MLEITPRFGWHVRMLETTLRFTSHRYDNDGLVESRLRFITAMASFGGSSYSEYMITRRCLAICLAVGLLVEG